MGVIGPCRFTLTSAARLLLHHRALHSRLITAGTWSTQCGSCVHADDSTSMKYADNGTRIADLNNILARVAEVACLFDNDGISVRAINRFVLSQLKLPSSLAMQADPLVCDHHSSGTVGPGPKTPF